MNEWLLLGILSFMALFAVGGILYPLRLTRLKKGVLALALLFFLGRGYLHWGSWFGLKSFYQKQAQLQQANQMLQSVGGRHALIQVMRQRLKQDPTQKEGWYLLGRLYMTVLSYEQAHQAFLHALAIDPKDKSIKMHDVQSIWFLRDQSLDQKSRKILEDILQDEPNQKDALAMLAMDAYRTHHYEKAIAYWERLLSFLPQQSDEARTIRKALSKAQEKCFKTLKKVDP